MFPFAHKNIIEFLYSLIYVSFDEKFVVDGNAKIDGNLDVTGSLTYEDVTNIESVGIITAKNGIHVTGAGVSVTGISTFINNVEFQDSIGVGTPTPSNNLHVVGTSKIEGAAETIIELHAECFPNS